MNSSTMRKEITDLSDEAKQTMSADMESLKSSFAQLRTDISNLVGDALGLGKSGANVMRHRASDAVDGLKDRIDELKDRGSDSIENIEKKIEENPLTSACVAFAVGFILAKFFSRR